jgi:hypothetical protein
VDDFSHGFEPVVGGDECSDECCDGDGDQRARGERGV